MEHIERNLELFREMITCSYDLYFWTYDNEMQLIYSNCPNAAVYNTIFILPDNCEYLQSYANEKGTPLLLTNTMGMFWITDFEIIEGARHRFHVLGPLFIDDVSVKSVENELHKLNLSLSLKKEFMELLELLPVIPFTRIYEYGLMLHYCLTGEKLTRSDINFQKSDTSFAPASIKPSADRHGTWAAEQAIMQLVREGCLDYQAKMNRLVHIGTLGKLSDKDPIRHHKNIGIIGTALCTRAAMEGGLSPEIAYTLSDYYIQNIEASNSLSEIHELSQIMREDFIKRVHRCRNNGGISKQIQESCDYISLHLESPMTLEDIASRAGYNIDYFAKKFKKEVGCSVSTYINRIKVEHAKLLLRSTKQSIQDISESLGFCSQSYFSETFRKITGEAPSVYRQKGGYGILS